MLTNPSTLGVFERRIQEVAKLVHEAGGLLYYDGANLNAILGKVRPGDMGFDVIHMNLHKTFSTPHGGGGPGSGAVGVGQRLLPFLPIPIVGKEGDRYRWLDERDLPQTIGRLSAFMGNAGVLLRAYVYMRMLGRAGMQRVAEYSRAECELPAGAAAAGRLRCRLSGAARQSRVHHHAQAPGEGARRQRDGLRQAPARLRLPRADDLLPAAGAGVPADRADRDRGEGGARRLRRGADRDPARRPNRIRRRSRAPRILCRCAVSTTCARPSSSI